MKRDSDDKSVSAKEAMADYYQILLGETSASEQPRAGTSSQEPAPVSAAPAESVSVESKDPEAERRKEWVEPQPLFESKKLTRSIRSFPEEPELTKPMVSPVIPAAFPKPAPQSVDLAPKAETLEIKTEPVTKTEPKPEPPVQNKVTEPVKEATKTIEVPAEKPITAERSDQQQKPKPWLDNGRPDWGQNRFECLLFSVAGLKLAVPLASLGSIHKLDQELTPLFGRASWFMGLYRWDNRNIQVVDTAEWVMPDRHNSQVRDGYRFIIRLGDSNWGMACDAVAEAIQLEPAQVKWRTERSKRPWLSGTVIEHMCALLDADTLGWLLDKDAAKH